MDGDQAIWLWLLGAIHGCGCVAGAWWLSFGNSCGHGFAIASTSYSNALDGISRYLFPAGKFWLCVRVAVSKLVMILAVIFGLEYWVIVWLRLPHALHLKCQKVDSVRCISSN
jgi:hypothetical protein